MGPCYVFHPLNAFDDGERVVLDVVRYDRMFDANRLGPDDSAPHLWRWTIDTATGTTHEEQLSDLPFEFPRVDERRVGRRHRYGYGTTIARGTSGNEFAGQLVRTDASDGTTQVVDLGAGRTSGEWVMVPRDHGSAEDDGWLLSLVHDATTDRSEVVVLAADDLAGGPVAAVELPNRVPVGFHGNWVADDR